MVSLKARWLAVGMVPWLVAGCPVKPVLPALASETTGDDGSTSLEASGSSSSTTGPGSAGSSTSDGSEGSTTGAAACTVEDACAPGSATWWNSSWSHRRRVEVSAALEESLDDMVVPVRLDAGFEYGCARADGADLRFVDGEGTVMAHELDEWRPGMASVAWVRVPSLGATGASFWLYHGNPAATAEHAEVWSQDLGHQSVLHFGGDLDDARGLHPGEPAVTGEPSYADDGVVGRAIHYEEILIDARAEIVGSDEIDDAIIASEALTVTAWIRPTPNVAAPGPYRTVLSRGSALWSMTVYDSTVPYAFSPPAYASFIHRCSELLDCLLADDYGNHSLVSTAAVIEHPVTAAWHHVAITFEATGGTYDKRIYIDGELDEQLVAPTPLAWDTMQLHTEPLTIGAGPLDSAQSVFQGEIDELRIASEAWEAERIRAEHAYTGQAELVTVGAVECR